MRRVLRRKLGWLRRLAFGRREKGRLLSPRMARRGLPPAPLDPETRLPLPRSPEPLPEDALRFMRHGAPRAADPSPLVPAELLPPPPPVLTPGAELRAMLDQVEDPFSLREAIEQAKEAHRRLAERLDADRTARAPPRLAVDPATPAAIAARREAEAALAEALALLKRIGEARVRSAAENQALTTPRSSARPGR
jgi:hypothetical protein